MCTGLSEYGMEWVHDWVGMGLSRFKLKCVWDGVGAGWATYELELVQEWVGMRWSGYRIEYGMEWVQDWVCMRWNRYRIERVWNTHSLIWFFIGNSIKFGKNSVNVVVFLSYLVFFWLQVQSSRKIHLWQFFWRQNVMKCFCVCKVLLLPDI